MTGPTRIVAGRYAISAAIGQGGMGRVWRAHDQTLDREVALKEVLLPLGMSESAKAQMAERMLREARFSARLRHPSIVRVHDVITAEDHPWIVMELVDGRSLEEIIEAEGALSPARVAAIGLSLLGALRAAHKSGVIHRDVKPANVLIEDDDAVVLTDFGIAYEMDQVSLTATGTMIGSPQFMAPERVRGESPGPASDLFSLGATLYAAVEGRAPFNRTGQLPTLAAVLSDPPDAFEHAGQLRPVLAGLLEKAPESRPTADEVEEALRTVMVVEAAPTTGDLSEVPTAPPAPVEVIPEPVVEPEPGAEPEPESVVKPESSTVTSPVLPDMEPVVEPKAPKPMRRLLILAAAVTAVVVLAGGTFAIIQANRPEFYNGFNTYTSKPPSGGFQKVSTSLGTLELGQGIRFGYATTHVPTTWRYQVSAEVDGGLNLGPRLASVSGTPTGSDQVVVAVEADHHLAPTAIAWFQTVHAGSQSRLPGYHLGVLKAGDKPLNGDTATAVWQFTWKCGDVERRVLMLARQRGDDIYTFMIATPATTSAANNDLYFALVTGVEFA